MVCSIEWSSRIYRWSSKVSFEALKYQIKKSDNLILCNIVIDEIAIRQQVTYDGQRYYGLIDFETDYNDTFNINRSLKATNALVFMLVAINGHWKIPVGYFLLNSLNGAERASLLEKCLELNRNDRSRGTFRNFWWS